MQRIAAKAGKPGIAAMLSNKVPDKKNARSGDLGEILAATYLHEECGYVVGPNRLIDRDHQNWAMRGDDVIGARFEIDSSVTLVKVEAKSGARMTKSVIQKAREGLDREGGLTSSHSLTQFAERLLGTVDDALGEAILDLLRDVGVRPKIVTHLMFLFTKNDPLAWIKADLSAYAGPFDQIAIALRVDDHPTFVSGVYDTVLGL